MRKLLSLCLSPVLLFSCCGTALAADISLDIKRVESLTPGEPIEIPTIRITGMFRQGDHFAVNEILMQRAARPGALPEVPLASVELSSLGGDLNEGLQIGYLFRDFNVATVVRKGDACLSSCALAFLGGSVLNEWSGKMPDRRIEIGSHLGFHSFYLNPYSAQAPTPSDPNESRELGFREAESGAAAIIRYAADLRIDPKFVASMLAKSAEEFVYVGTNSDLLTLKICPIGLNRPSISIPEQALNICNHATGWNNPATLSALRARSRGWTELYLLERVQRNMLSLEAKGALSRKLASYSVMRDQHSIDNLYADLRAAGVTLPEIVGPVFEVDGYRSGSRDLQCFVSLSLDNPDKYDIAIIEPNEMVRAYRSAPEDCRRLFLYDKDAPINIDRP